MRLEPDIEKLRAAFESRQLHGVVALIDYLITPEARGLIEIESSTIDVNALLGREDSEIPNLTSLHIGSRNGSRTPLQWLKDFSTYLETAEQVQPKALHTFDTICRSFVSMATAPASGNVEIYTAEGKRVLTAEEYTAEEAERRNWHTH
jgi:hypothetical protein